MKPRLSPTLAGLAALAALTLAGCAGSPPTRYYTLADAAMPAAAPARPGAAPLAIELAPLALPERLARPQMVVRDSGSAGDVQVMVLEQHRWASSFENELRDALASGIAARLGALDLTKAGRTGAPPSHRIAVQLRQFDAIDGSRVDTAFGWTVRRADESRGLACQLSLSEPAGSSGVDALAQSAQRLTGKMAEAIARSVSGGGCPG